jgi:hypothetical protein
MPYDDYDEYAHWQVLNFPTSLRVRFKRYCKKRDFTMSAMLTKMIEKELDRSRLRRDKEEE